MNNRYTNQNETTQSLRSAIHQMPMTKIALAGAFGAGMMALISLCVSPSKK